MEYLVREEMFIPFYQEVIKMALVLVEPSHPVKTVNLILLLLANVDGDLPFLFFFA